MAEISVAFIAARVEAVILVTKADIKAPIDGNIESDIKAPSKADIVGSFRKPGKPRILIDPALESGT